MKNYLKKLLQKILRFFAVQILRKYQPEIVAITGSVGKTSTREAIYTVLASTYNVRTNFKNYNNEIGIPLTIIGRESGGQSPLKWLVVIFRALQLIIFKAKNFPDIFVLELGADHPGDIKYLTSFLPIKIAVVTAIAAAHLEFFETVDQIAKEKSYLVRGLSKAGYAVLNVDDHLVYGMKGKTNAQIVTYGLAAPADFKAVEIAVSHEVNYKDISTIQGISFKLLYKGSTVPVLLPKVLGEHLVYTALAAIAVGTIYDLNLHTIIDSLKSYQPPKGRMHIVAGIKNTLIIDDTYNSSPLAAAKALYQLSQINLDNHHKKYAVLGDMLELGRYSEQAHQEVGEAAASYKMDYLITVGERARDMVRAAIAGGLAKDHCFSFAATAEAGLFLQDRLEQGDLVLIKGSQGMRMERIVKEVMAEPEKAGELLVRQGKEWE